MSQLAHFQLIARYNAWMNDKLYAAAGQLSPQTLSEDRGAFFPSILATLNHIALADIIWLKRFAEHPACAELRAAISDQRSATASGTGSAAIRHLRAATRFAHPAGWAYQRLGNGADRGGPGACTGLRQYEGRAGAAAVRQPDAAFLQSSNPPSRPGQHLAAPGRSGYRRDRFAGADCRR